MLRLNNLIGFGGAAKTVPQIDFLAAYEVGAPASTSFTISSVGSGEAKDRTLIIVSVVDGTAQGSASVKYAGYYGSLIGVFGANLASATHVACIDLPASAATSGDLIVDLAPTTPTCAAFGVYISYDMYGGRAETYLGGINTNPHTFTNDTTLPAAIIAGAYGTYGSAITASWSGLTENYDSQIGSDANYCSFASGQYLVSGSRTITCTWTNSTNSKYVGAAVTQRSAKSRWTKLIQAGGSNDTAAASTTRTFSAQDTGPAYEGRLLVACGMYDYSSGTPTVSSVTIGGVSATIAVQANSGSAGVGTYIAYAIVPSGTAVDIVATFSASVVTGRIKLHVVENYQSSTPHVTDSDSGAKTALSFGVEMPAGSIAVGAYADNAAGASAADASGAFAYSYGSPGAMDVGAFCWQATDYEASRAITITTTTANSAGVVAVWR